MAGVRCAIPGAFAGMAWVGLVAAPLTFVLFLSLFSAGMRPVAYANAVQTVERRLADIDDRNPPA